MLAAFSCSWWWVKDDLYCVSFEPRQGYTALQSWAVRAWLPSTPRQIFLLKRVGD